MSDPSDPSEALNPGVLSPEDFTFDAINEYAHNPDVSFDDLQGRLLSLAAFSDKTRDELRANLSLAVQLFESTLEEAEISDDTEMVVKWPNGQAAITFKAMFKRWKELSE